MNYYERNPGDKAKHTPHLTLQQIGALVQMEDFCHGTEKLLPLDDDRFFALIRARSRSEKLDALKIREEFFEKTEIGWLSHEIEERIKESVGKSGKASRSARIRWENDKKKKADAMRTHSDGNAGTHSDGNANGMPRARVHDPVASNHKLIATGASSASGAAEGLSDPISAEVDPQTIPTGHESAEKKEGGGGEEVWLDWEQPEVTRALNRALGRDERRGLIPRESAGLELFSRAYDGQVCPAHFDEVLMPFLMAHPRIGQPGHPDWDALPIDSLLKKRKRYALNVIEDLANQLDYARAWAAKPGKKEKAPEEMLPCPCDDWMTFAVERIGWAPSAGLQWSDLGLRSQREFIAAFEAEKRRDGANE